jgi:hypothetical protein
MVVLLASWTRDCGASRASSMLRSPYRNKAASQTGVSPPQAKEHLEPKQKFPKGRKCRYRSVMLFLDPERVITPHLLPSASPVSLWRGTSQAGATITSQHENRGLEITLKRTEMLRDGEVQLSDPSLRQPRTACQAHRSPKLQMRLRSKTKLYGPDSKMPQSTSHIGRPLCVQSNTLFSI